MFIEWIVDWIQEVINNTNLYWLEAQTSFYVDNNIECQLDFLIFAKAFQFKFFESNVNVPNTNAATNKKLFNFYMK